MIKHYFRIFGHHVIYGKGETTSLDSPLDAEHQVKMIIISGFGHMNFSEPGNPVYINKQFVYDSQYAVIEEVFEKIG
jgi:hypothetical protein